MILLITVLCAIGLFFGGAGYRLVTQNLSSAPGVLTGLFLILLGIICIISGFLFRYMLIGRAA